MSSFMILVTKVIFVLSHVASLGKCAFRIQNQYLFIDYRIEKWYWGGILEKWRIVTSAFTTHHIRVNRLAICLQKLVGQGRRS